MSARAPGAGRAAEAACRPPQMCTDECSSQEVVVMGGGPIGIDCSLAAPRRGLHSRVGGTTRWVLGRVDATKLVPAEHWARTCCLHRAAGSHASSRTSVFGPLSGSVEEAAKSELAAAQRVVALLD